MLEIYIYILVGAYWVLPFACSVDVVGGICVASVWLCRVLVPVLCRYAVPSRHYVVFHVLIVA